MLARERQDLLDEGLKIPYIKPSEGGAQFVKLDKWCRVLRYEDEDGLVWTDRGVFYSIDLDFKEVEPGTAPLLP